MKRNFLLVLSISLLLTACQKGTIFSSVSNIPTTGWDADSAIAMQVMISDSAECYDIDFFVRHTDAYPYQNLWLFVEQQWEGQLIGCDTVEATLANNYGEWFGSGSNSKELLMRYAEAFSFPRTGQYTFIIHQGMRAQQLTGVCAFGMQIHVHGEE